jgi:hypothetical protein
MISDRDMTRIVRSWLEDGANVIPDRVLDSVLAELPTTPQRRHWWQAWRNTFVMNSMRLALAAGAVVLATFVGLGIYFNQGGLVGPPPTPAPSVEPSPAGSPTTVPMFRPAGGNVPAGTYVTSPPFPLQIEFTVPAGWESWGQATDGLGVSKYGAGPPAGSGFGFWIVGEVYSDPCRRLTTGPVNPGSSVDDLAFALQSLENYQTAAPTDVSLGGYSGKYLEITAPADLRLSDCEAADPRLWRTERGGNRSVYGPEEHDRIWILDVDGTRLLVKMAYRPGTPESDVAELEQMVDSIRIHPPSTTPTIEPTPAPTPSSFAELRDDQPIEPGSYVTDTGFPLRVVFDVPEGWTKWLGGEESVALYWNSFNPPNGAALGFTLVGDVYADPCRWLTSRTEVGPTVDDLAQALVDRPNVEATSPADVTLAGYAGKYLEVTNPEDLSECDGGKIQHWESPSGQSGRDDPHGGDRDRIWILDVDGVRLIMGAANQPDTPEDVLDQLAQMVESIHIEPRATATLTSQVPAPSPMSFSRLGGIEGTDVPAGTYLTDFSFPLQIQFTVPAGWQRWTAEAEGTGVYKHRGERPLGSRFGFWLVEKIAQDPCDPDGGAVDPGPTAEDLANALQGIENWTTTAPADVSLGGFSGKYVELTAPAELPRCVDGRGLETASLLGHRIGPGSRWLLWILDVDGTRLVVMMAYRPPTPEADVAELHQLVDSVVIQP